MERTLLPQAVYDHLITSLARNGKALKYDQGFFAVIDRIERNKRTEREGVSVRTDALDLASRMIQSNIERNGQKYGSVGDEVLLMDIADAREASMQESPVAAAPVPESHQAPAAAPADKGDQPPRLPEVTSPPAAVEAPPGHPPLPDGAYFREVETKRYLHSGRLQEVTAVIEKTTVICTDETPPPQPPNGWYWFPADGSGYELFPVLEFPDEN